MPEFAVLIPQEETFTEGGGQDMPPGFHEIVLPYVDDIRAPPKNMSDNLVGASDSGSYGGSRLTYSYGYPGKINGKHCQTLEKQGRQVSIGSLPESRCVENIVS